jgi:hypothetical protein
VHDKEGGVEEHRICTLRSPCSCGLSVSATGYVLTLRLLLAVTATELLACPQMAMWSNGDVMEVLKEEWQLSPETVGCD